MMAGTRPIEQWLSAYERAWATGEDVAALFTADARYFTAPYRQPFVGADVIESWWHEQGEAAIRWTFEYEVVATDGPMNVVKGTTAYHDTIGPDGKPQVYYNLWLVTLDDSGRAREFVEYWMLPE